MASVYLELRNYKNKRGECAIRLVILSGGATVRRNTPFKVLPEQWDADRQKVNRRHSGYTEINDALSSILDKATKEVARQVATNDGYAPGAHSVYEKSFATHDFYEATEKMLAAMPPQQWRTQKKYTVCLNQLKAFRAKLMVEHITPAFIEDFRAHLSPGRKKNTVINRLSTFRTLYNKCPFKLAQDPFAEVVIGTYRKTSDPSPTIADILALWQYVPKTPSERLAVDAFLFSFFAAGMRSGDVLTLTWAEIGDEYIIYDQQKKEHLGADKISIPLNTYTRDILSRQPKNSKYVFNCIKSADIVQQYKEIEGKQAMINYYLKIAAINSGVGKPLKFKQARQAFANAAKKRSGGDVYSIKGAMGHTKMATTEIYLGNDQGEIDDLLQTVYTGLE